MFKTGDYVIHKSEGVCLVEKIINRNFGDGVQDYYVLRPRYYNGTATIMIPVLFCGQIRNVINKSDALKVIDGMADTEDIWITDNKKRKELFTKIINDGDIISLCALINAAYRRKTEYAAMKKDLPLVDTTLSNLAERLVFEELAFALDIPLENVPAYISEHLKN